jgi:hypothetical protein
VLSEFKPFAAATESMEATPLGAATPGDDVDMLTQSVELRFQSISLEQVILSLPSSLFSSILSTDGTFSGEANHDGKRLEVRPSSRLVSLFVFSPQSSYRIPLSPRLSIPQTRSRTFCSIARISLSLFFSLFEPPWNFFLELQSNRFWDSLQFRPVHLRFL